MTYVRIFRQVVVLAGNGPIHLSMPGMSAQVSRESVEKQSGLNPFTVTNVSVLFQVEAERAAEDPISVKWGCWWVENDWKSRSDRSTAGDGAFNCVGEKLTPDAE